MPTRSEVINRALEMAMAHLRAGPHALRETPNNRGPSVGRNNIAMTAAKPEEWERVRRDARAHAVVATRRTTQPASRPAQPFRGAKSTTSR